MEIGVEQKIEAEPKRKEVDAASRELPPLNADLPEDIQIDILSRLPSLSKCKCVSKHWNTTVTLEAFLLCPTRSYGKHSKLGIVARNTCWTKRSIYSFEFADKNTPKTVTNTVGGTTAEMVRGEYMSFPDALMSKFNTMSNICNNLACLFYTASSRIRLLNIETHDFIDLPPAIIISESAVRDSILDAFIDKFHCKRNRVDNFWCCLGYDPIQKKFNVLSIITEIHPVSKQCRSKVAILALGSNNWQPIDDDIVPCSVRERCSPRWTRNNSFCLDGVIYWVQDDGIHTSSILTVVSFDLTRGVFRDFKLAVNVIQNMSRYYYYYFTSLKGCPTLFNWKTETKEIIQMTLSDHKNPNAAWSRRIFTSDVLFKMLRDGFVDTGGSILLLQHVDPMVCFWGRRYDVPHDEPKYSWYSWYDLNNIAV